MKTEIASCKTFGATRFSKGGVSTNMFYPRQVHRDGSIDQLLGIRTGADLF